MNAFIELERVEFRVLGALRCLDAVTGTPIERAMSVEAQGTRIVRNRSGLYVLIEAPGFDDYNASFPAPPATPAVGSVAFPVTVSDPLGAYLPRSASISLPRDPDPANAGSDTSLFRPIELPMLPSPAGAVATNWAVLRISVTANNGDCLGGALIRVLRNGSVLARGLSDWRGEALVPVAGVPVTTFSEDANAVVITEIEVTLQAVFDAASGLRTPAANVAAGSTPPQLPVVDPTALEAAVNTLPAVQQQLMIAARREQALSLVIDLP